MAKRSSHSLRPVPIPTPLPSSSQFQTRDSLVYHDSAFFREYLRMVYKSALLEPWFSTPFLCLRFSLALTPFSPACPSASLRRSYAGILIREAPLYRNYHFYPSSLARPFIPPIGIH